MDREDVLTYLLTPSAPQSLVHDNTYSKKFHNSLLAYCLVPPLTANSIIKLTLSVFFSICVCEFNISGLIMLAVKKKRSPTDNEYYHKVTGMALLTFDGSGHSSNMRVMTAGPRGSAVVILLIIE